MKIIVDNYVVKSMNYDGIENIKEVLEIPDNDNGIEIEENIEVQNEYAFRKDKTGCMVDTTVNVYNKLGETSLETINLNIYFVMSFKLENGSDNTFCEEIEPKDLVEIITPYVNPTIEAVSINIISNIKQQGILNKTLNTGLKISIPIPYERISVD